jgi:hypothetical protein
LNAEHESSTALSFIAFKTIPDFPRHLKQKILRMEVIHVLLRSHR